MCIRDSIYSVWLEAQLIFSTPTEKKRSRKKKIVVDVTRDVIRRKIHNFYVVKKEFPTLKKVKCRIKKRKYR